MEKNNKTLNVPNLRFPEFSGEWDVMELQDIAPNICSGRDKPSHNGKVILYGSTGVIGMTESASYLDELILVARVGANAGQLQVANSPCGVTDNALVINAHEWNAYIYYYLQYYNLNRLVFGSGQPLITGGMLKKKKIKSGKNVERLKITHLLSLLDQRIETQKKVIEDLKKLKDAISKSLFSRYDLLEAKMQISQIGSLKNGYAFQSSSYDSSGEYEIITIANVAGERHICTEDCNRIHTLPSDLQPHQELKDGDILISLTGNVGRVSLCKEGKYLLNQRVGLLQLKAGVNREFVYQVLSSHKFELSMISCGQGAAQMNIGKGDVESFVIPYSNNYENLQRISLILRSHDKLVLNESTRLQLLLNQKQYIISNIFI